jgi:hypothetical protein
MVRLLLTLAALSACGRIGFGPGGGGGATTDGGLPPCTTGVCECNVDIDCAGVHTVCGAHGGSHTCDCAAGYGLSGGACAFSGLVADPGFQTTTTWTTTGSIDPLFMQAGMIEPGRVALVALQRASQTITMPKRTRAEPLVLVVSSLRHTLNDRPSVGIGKFWIDTTSTAGYTATRTCLGAAQYAPESTVGAGAPVTLQVMPTQSAFELDVDRVDIVPAMAGECTTPGPVANGDAEGNGNWTFQSLPTNGPDGTAAGFVAGVGANGSRGAQLHVTFGCDEAKLSLAISSLPVEEMPSTALVFWLDADIGEPVTFAGALAPGQRIGTGAGAMQSACIPATARGMPATIAATIAGQNAFCMMSSVFTATFDNVALTSDPACGSDPDLPDPGFESQYLPFGVFISPMYSSAYVDATVAHTGTASLRLGATNTCNSSVGWATSVVPPASTTGAGPALEFYYRAAPINHFKLAVQATGAAATLVQDGTWRRGVACFDPQLAGRAQRVTFELVDAMGTCLLMGEEVAHVDDLALVTDPSCPQ